MALGFAAAVAVLAAVGYWIVQPTLIDDTYITLSYARNLAEDLHWGLLAGEPANTATSPLNVILLALLTLPVRNPIVAAGVLAVAASSWMAWSAVRAARFLGLPLIAAVVAVALVVFNPFVISSAGLETGLAAALLVALLHLALAGRVAGFGVVAGLAAVTRADLVVFAVLLAVAAPAVRRRLPLAALAAAAVAAPWYVFSWWFFGSLVPDTLVMKTTQRSFGPWDFTNGPLLYWGDNRSSTLLGFVPALLGLLALLGWASARVLGSAERRLDPVAALGLGGVAYYAAYSLLGVPPYHWYYGPVLASLSVAAVYLFALPRLRRAGIATLATCAALAVLALGQAAEVVRQGVPWDREPLVATNMAASQDYARVAGELRDRVGDGRVGSSSELGALAYHCRCAVIDEFSDRDLVKGLIGLRIAGASAVMQTLLRANFYHLDLRTDDEPLDYQLRWIPGPAPAPLPPPAIDAWDVDSNWTGPGHLLLLPPGG